MRAHGYIPYRRRVYYVVNESGKPVDRNLDGGILVRTAHGEEFWLWDYTIFHGHNAPLTDQNMSTKRGDCFKRFPEMLLAKFEPGFQYLNCRGILVSWIQYNGLVTMELVQRTC